MNEKCIIFDMDGTLVNSKKNITNSVNHTRKLLNLEPISEDLIYKYINIPSENLALRFYNEEEFSPKTKRIFYEHYINECVNDLHLYDGIMDILSFFKTKAKLAIATNAYDIFAIKIVKYLKIEEYFDLIVGANSANSSKPDPKIINFIANKLHVTLNNSVLIGDSQKDELCAKNANTNFIFATWGYGDYKSDERFLCNSPHELKEKIIKVLNM